MKRVFIAVKVDPVGELLKVFSSIKALLGAENIKWVDPGNIHLTLAFLGDTEEKKIKILSNMLGDICSRFKGFEFVLAGTGVFKNLRDPRVLWLGLRSTEKLSVIYQLITEGLNKNGFRTEERPFSPHLTLGRIKSVKDTENLKNVLERYRDVEFQKVDAREVILYESILMQTGPIYKPLGKYMLL
jgi:RNA 2',3'-cyclic 3'-phosphodiesterase